MPVTTAHNEEEYTTYEPAEHEFFTLEGLDVKNYRRMFANPFDLGMDDLYVERTERDALDPRSLELPSLDTVPEEISNAGFEKLTIDGKRWDTYGMTHGFVVNQYDENDVNFQRQGVYEMMSFMMDVMWFKGTGNDQWDGMFNYLNSSLPSERVIDCSNWNGSTDSDGDLTGHEEDLINSIAFSRVEDRTLPSSGGWQTAFGDRSVLASLRASEATDGGFAGPSYWERLTDANSLQNFEPVPRTRNLSTVPRDSEIPQDDIPSFDLVDTSTAVNPDGPQIGYDELYLFPSMDTVKNNYWALGEMGTPDYEPYQMRKRRVAHDYFSRYTAYPDPDGRFSDVPDIVKLTNVSELFGDVADPSVGQ